MVSLAFGQSFLRESMTIARLNEPVDTQQQALADENQYDIVGLKMAKEFRITDNGGFEYYDGKEIVNMDEGRKKRSFSDGYKPITGRTFYLEARRLKLLPQSLQYFAFMQMSIDEKREALTNNPNWELVLVKKKLTIRKKQFDKEQQADDYVSKRNADLESGIGQIGMGYLPPDSIYSPDEEITDGILSMRDLITHQRDKYKFSYNARNKIRLTYDQDAARLINHNKVNQNTLEKKTVEMEDLNQAF